MSAYYENLTETFSRVRHGSEGKWEVYIHSCVEGTLKKWSIFINNIIAILQHLNCKEASLAAGGLDGNGSQLEKLSLRVLYTYCRMS